VVATIVDLLAHKVDKEEEDDDDDDVFGDVTDFSPVE
jgi:hypothetical protein